MASRGGYTVRDLLIFAFYSWRVIVIVGLIPLLIGVAASLTAKKYYTANGLILVLVNREHSGTEGVSDAGPSVLSIDGLKLVQSEAEIIVSDGVLADVVRQMRPEVLYPAVAKRRLFGLLPPADENEWSQRAVERLRDDLKAQVREESSVIGVSFRHVDPQLAAAVTSAVIKAYQERRRKVFDVVRSPLLNEEVRRFADDLQGIDAQIRAVKLKYGAIEIDQDIILAVNQSDVLLQRTRQAQERRAMVIEQVTAARAKLAAEPLRLFDYGEQTNQILNDEDRNLLTKLELELQGLKKLYAPDFPLRAQTEKRIALLKESIREKAKPQYQINREVRNPTLDFMNSRLFELEVESDSLDDQIAELERLSKEAASRVDELREAQFLLHELERTRKVMEDVYHQYALRAEAVKMDEKAAAEQTNNVRVIELPEVPVTGATMAWSFLAAGLFGGILAGIAGGFLANINRQVYLLPSEAERQLGLSALASFMVGAPRPKHRASDEEMGHLSSQILDTLIGDRGLGSLHILPVDRDAADIALLQGLLTECAVQRSLSVLLVDLGDGQGIARALGLRPQTAATRRTADVGHAPLPGFGHVEVAIEPLSSPVFDLRVPLRQAVEGVAALQQAFDLVVIVAPPLSAGHIGRRASAIVDATILMLKAESSRGPAAVWTRDAVLEAGGDILGFIMTGRRFHIPSRIYKWL
ncbi:GumC family protein [Zavarzinia aquatilis]|uniref:Polysaccharide chain length determinant N-terminal domain-containing protein n=1 Tax=Zavarzinia aquatilis TaxID=2211142 RepID=A0A317EHC8_9PROT|nr:Wzz/FepE/Etk N-terminal domain-containing protein [Zavarzinia aquatilis]PWR25480.1 hypothetical protein DKG74_00430 [Zavarzinia aquatilis]